jgi:hypothetical protein
MTGVAPTGTSELSANGKSAKLGAGSVGTKIDLKGFGGEVVTHDGKMVTLEGLVGDSGSGVVSYHPLSLFLLP